MADAVLTLSLTNVRVDGHGEGRVVREYTVTFDSGTDMTAGGYALDFQGATNTNKLPRAKWSRNPDGYAVLNSPVGWLAKIIPGTSLTTWKLEIYGDGGATAGHPLAEALDGQVALSTDTSIRIQLSGKNL